MFTCFLLLFKIFFLGIHWDFHTVDDLRQYFIKYGEVEQVEIVGQPRGYGFVVFQDKSSADKCLADNQIHIINGQKIDVKVIFYFLNLIMNILIRNFLKRIY